MHPSLALRAGACPRRRAGSRCAPHATRRRRGRLPARVRTVVQIRARGLRERAQELRVEVAPAELADPVARARLPCAPDAFERGDAAEVEVRAEARRVVGGEIVAASRLPVAGEADREPPVEPLATGLLAAGRRLGRAPVRHVRQPARLDAVCTEAGRVLDRAQRHVAPRAVIGREDAVGLQVVERDRVAEGRSRRSKRSASAARAPGRGHSRPRRHRRRPVRARRAPRRCHRAARRGSSRAASAIRRGRRATARENGDGWRSGRTASRGSPGRGRRAARPRSRHGRPRRAPGCRAPAGRA